MRLISIPTALLVLAATTTSARSEPENQVIISSNDHHEYVGADYETIVFPNKVMTLNIYYKDSPHRQISKVSVECFRHHKSFTFDKIYFSTKVWPVMDTEHDEKGRVKRTFFQLDLKTDISSEDFDHTLEINCTSRKIEFSLAGQDPIP